MASCQSAFSELRPQMSRRRPALCTKNGVRRRAQDAELVRDAEAVRRILELTAELEKRADAMQKDPKMMDIVRRAYQLWQENGQPEGKDQEFYFLAEKELREAEEPGDSGKER